MIGSLASPPRRTSRAAPRRRVLDAARAIPAAAWVCALVAVLNATAWSLLTPPFQLPDEPAQYAYAEHLAQTGRPPAERPMSTRVGASPEEQLAMRDLRSNEVAAHGDHAGVWLALEQRRLARDLHAGASRRGDGYSYGATPQPPLYYALMAIPYRIADRGTMLQRLALMRFASALLGGLTALFAFLFLREALPRVPWAWSVGGLAVALQPMFASSTSGVNPDVLLFTASAGLFLCIARAFRHGLSVPLTAATGAVVAVGLLAKLNFIGLLPGAALALLLAAIRSSRAAGHRRPRLATLRALALALAIPAAAVGVEMLLNARLWERPAIGLLSANGGVLLRNGSLGHHLAFLWESYAPPLPGMERIFPRDMTFVHFDEFVGAFGGRDTRFPTWFDRSALALAAIAGALALRGAWLARAAVRRRVAELLCYGAMAAGLVLMVTAQYYVLETLFQTVGEYHQVRYMLPLVPLYAALVALAARGGGRRMPIVGAAILVLAIAHDVWGQLLLVSRFYA